MVKQHQKNPSAITMYGMLTRKLPELCISGTHTGMLPLLFCFEKAIFKKSPNEHLGFSFEVECSTLKQAKLLLIVTKKMTTFLNYIFRDVIDHKGNQNQMDQNT